MDLKLIKKNYDKAHQHNYYCKLNCDWYHTDRCIKLSKSHNRSYVYCNSSYCKRYNRINGFSITHMPDVFNFKEVIDANNLDLIEPNYFSDIE